MVFVVVVVWGHISHNPNVDGFMCILVYIFVVTRTCGAPITCNAQNMGDHVVVHNIT